MIEELDSLTVFAEVGAAFAGFATLAGMLRRDFDAKNLAFGVVEVSLIVVAFSLLPAVIDNLRVTAALFVAVLAAGGASAQLRQRSATGVKAGFAEVPSMFGAALMLVLLASLALGLVVALAIQPEHAPRLYTSAVLGSLLLAGLMLWLAVRNVVFSPEGSAPT